MGARSMEPRWCAQRILVLGGGLKLKFIFLHRPARQKNRRAKEMSASFPQRRKKKKEKKEKEKKVVPVPRILVNSTCTREMRFW
jgi:hypothetical protein